jgi:predicted nucleic acid-binding OB-fold protein
LESIGKKRTNEMLNEELNMILKSYEDVIKKLGDETSPSTVKRYCELVGRNYRDPTKIHDFVKTRFDDETLQLVKNKMNNKWIIQN